MVLESVYNGKCIDFARRRRENVGGLEPVYKGGCIDFARRRRENFENLLSNDS